MHPLFAASIETLHAKFEQLIASPVIGMKGAKPKQGIYLFSEAGRHLYVGRSNNIPGRYTGHSGLGASYNSAAFAMLLAREATGRKAVYKAGEGNRKHLMTEEAFLAAFTSAKARIRAMEFRAVEESDQTRQTLLEVYCAIVLETPYNDFGTH